MAASHAKSGACRANCHSANTRNKPLCFAMVDPCSRFSWHRRWKSERFNPFVRVAMIGNRFRWISRV